MNEFENNFQPDGPEKKLPKRRMKDILITLKTALQKRNGILSNEEEALTPKYLAFTLQITQEEVIELLRGIPGFTVLTHWPKGERVIILADRRAALADIVQRLKPKDATIRQDQPEQKTTPEVTKLSEEEIKYLTNIYENSTDLEFSPAQPRADKKFQMKWFKQRRLEFFYKCIGQGILKKNNGKLEFIKQPPFQ